MLQPMNLGVGEYAGGEGVETFGNLLKALSASGQGGPTGAPFIPEDLELEAYTVLWDEDHLKLLRQLPVIPARAIVHEFTRITGYTGTDSEGFLRDGGTPNNFEFASERAVEQIRPIGEGFSVTGPMASVQTITALGSSDIVAVQRTTKLLGLMQKMVRAIYFSNTNGFGTSATPKFRGIEEIIVSDADAQNVVNVAGNTLIQKNFDNAARIIQKAFGQMTHVNLSPDALTNYTQTLQDVRNVVGISQDYAGAGYAGIRINAVRHAFGESDLVDDLFLDSQFSRYKPAPVFNATTNPIADNAPATTSTISGAVVAPTVAGSEFTAVDVAEFGTYYYGVTSDNSHSVVKDKTGESALAIIGGGTPTGFVVLAGGAADITTDGTANTDAVTFKIYRAIVASTDPKDYQFIGEIANGGTATEVFRDLNAIISHTKDSTGLIAPTTVAFALTLPTFRKVTKAGAQMKMQHPGEVPDAVKRLDLRAIFPRPQAILGDLAINELLLWYGAVEVPTPNRVVVLRNIGNRNL